MHEIEIKNMARMALDARDRAYAPYSQYKVGACAKGGSGAYYIGCNIENASYGLTNCAERTAIFKGISECEKSFTAIAIAGIDKGYPMPCGACRQVMSEFCAPYMPVVIVNAFGDYEVYTLSELLPYSFDKANLVKSTGDNE